MRKITTFIEAEQVGLVDASAVDVLELAYDTRKKSRFKAQASSGEQLGVILPRGRVLRGGDVLADESGALVRVVAAPEQISRVHSEDPWLLARAAYHLGNRHVPLQVDSGWLSYQHDHVLDAMVQGLGLRVSVEQAGFEPEEGAYSAHSKEGAKSHSHGAHEYQGDHHSHNH
jgi:urease accessory protein